MMWPDVSRPPGRAVKLLALAVIVGLFLLAAAADSLNQWAVR